jgi:isopenicillin-N N-acyltransferase-like protein
MFRREIHELAEIRMERMCSLSGMTRAQDILDLAERHLAILEKFDADLMEELKGLSKASGVSLPRLVVLNHYTDMRDITANRDPGGCSIVFSPTAEGKILGQTWDIHASALDFVILLKFKDALVFSVMGCLGMTGLNHRGVGVCINNLSSYQAQVGIIWPALVRKILMQKTAQSAQDELMKAPIGSGRHYAIADEENFFGTEVSSSRKVVISNDASKPYCHTNHCLDESMATQHFIREGSNTLWRYAHLTSDDVKKRISTQAEVFLALKDVSLSPQKNQLHQVATCGTIVMNINQRSMLACAGVASEEQLKWPQTLQRI